MNQYQRNLLFNVGREPEEDAFRWVDTNEDRTLHLVAIDLLNSKSQLAICSKEISKVRSITRPSCKQFVKNRKCCDRCAEFLNRKICDVKN